MTDLIDRKCTACEGGVAPMTQDAVKKMLDEIIGWQTDDRCVEIKRVFEFKGYYKTMAFVNAIAWVAHNEKHHPDLEVSYNRCVVKFTTHAIGGLSENDFICAAKVDAIYRGASS